MLPVVVAVATGDTGFLLLLPVIVAAGLFAAVGVRGDERFGGGQLNGLGGDRVERLEENVDDPCRVGRLRDEHLADENVVDARDVHSQGVLRGAFRNSSRGRGVGGCWRRWRSRRGGGCGILLPLLGVVVGGAKHGFGHRGDFFDDSLPRGDLVLVLGVGGVGVGGRVAAFGALGVAAALLPALALFLFVPLFCNLLFGEGLQFCLDGEVFPVADRDELPVSEDDTDKVPQPVVQTGLRLLLRPRLGRIADDFS